MTLDPRAWCADTIDDRQRWYLPLSKTVRDGLAQAIRDWRQTGQPITTARTAPALIAACAQDIARAKRELESGRGFCTLTVGEAAEFTRDELAVCYWLIGHLLGAPIEQNVQGTLLYDVRDTGQDVRYGARFSVTNAESSFHTDNAFGEEVLDYVGLLCLNAAKSGGASQIVSGLTVRNILSAKHPEVWRVLCQPFHIDRRGGLRPGDAPTIQFPVFSDSGSESLIRYLRYWIEVGHDKVSQPLTGEQVRALDTLDCVASDPALRVEFAMRPGEMLFVNNRWILHNRTAFEDYEEPERKRHLLRLWVRR